MLTAVCFHLSNIKQRRKSPKQNKLDLELTKNCHEPIFCSSPTKRAHDVPFLGSPLRVWTAGFTPLYGMHSPQFKFHHVCGQQRHLTKNRMALPSAECPIKTTIPSPQSPLCCSTPAEMASQQVIKRGCPLDS